ncbi:hypothetical protein ACIO6T_34690, partial [Streptomyces sp. NPDC087532]|uniref:hypothetical protein n=1 Tax=Streptomyces sp. NPDC087532 TaxID=3365795 RepID=UPI003818F357
MLSNDRAPPVSRGGRRSGASALRRFGASALRRFGASALRRFGASALRRFEVFGDAAGHLAYRWMPLLLAVSE